MATGRETVTALPRFDERSQEMEIGNLELSGRTRIAVMNVKDEAFIFLSE